MAIEHRAVEPYRERRLVSLLGLPFDCITLAQTVDCIRAAAAERTPLFLSTANVNFVVSAQHDAAFRDSLFESQLCVADGTPLVWIARLLRLPLRERVAGADVFQALREHAGPPLGVYFFGGPPGVAERACAVLNAEGRGLCCVGYQSPGFGSVESMSTPEQLQHIRAARPDFLVVSLGARKGQAWIRRNRHAIDVPVVSHLGAVVNFVAGAVARAPAWMGAAGIEWCWRIAQEPALWRRYASDGWQLLRLVATQVPPQLWRERRRLRP